MNKTEEIEETGITIQSSDTSFALTKQQIFKEISDELKKQGMKSTYIVSKLKYVIDEAYIINNNGDRMPDFKSMIRGIELLIKLTGIDIGNKIQVAVFNNMPKPGDKLQY